MPGINPLVATPPHAARIYRQFQEILNDMTYFSEKDRTEDSIFSKYNLPIMLHIYDDNTYIPQNKTSYMDIPFIAFSSDQKDDFASKDLNDQCAILGVG